MIIPYYFTCEEVRLVHQWLIELSKEYKELLSQGKCCRRDAQTGCKILFPNSIKVTIEITY